VINEDYKFEKKMSTGRGVLDSIFVGENFKVFVRGITPSRN
jgi:hypothetical protein